MATDDCLLSRVSAFGQRADDNGNGWIDEGWDGVDNNGDGQVDELAEWESELWTVRP